MSRKCANVAKSWSNVILVLVIVQIFLVSGAFSNDDILFSCEYDDRCVKERNDPCRTPTVEPGICKTVSDCPVIHQMIFVQKVYNYVSCGFEGIAQLVCCPQENITTTIRSGAPDDTCINSETGENGLIKFTSYCPELNGEISELIDEALCSNENYALCYDIVCCPVRNSTRLKQKCRFSDDLDNEMKLRANLNIECDTPIANGTKAFYSTECQLTNQPKVILTDTSKVQPQCCPISSIKKFSQWDSDDLRHVKVIGRNCSSSQNPNAKGNCRPHNQCPSGRVIDHTVCYTNRETLFVCCEEEMPTGPKPFELDCYSYSQEVYFDTYNLVDEQIDYSTRTRFEFDRVLIQGILAKPTEYPHMVALGHQTSASKIEFSCSGSLISNKFVLTVAHCLHIYDLITGRQVPVIKVRVGITTLNMSFNSDDCPEDYDVEELIPYPDFTREKYYNDIGLIKLKQSVLFTAYVRPICLPTSNKIPPEVIALGYGAVSDINPTNDKLVKIQLDTYSTDECRKYFIRPFKKLNQGIDPTNQVCAGSRSLLLNACPADSGGSIITPHTHFYETSILIGLTTYSKMCGFINNPGIYTLVYPYRDWIASIVWNNS